MKDDSTTDKTINDTKVKDPRIDQWTCGTSAPGQTRHDGRLLADSSIEQFTASDLLTLRNELLQGNVDSFQAAQIVTNFLSGRGYGISSQEARSAASRIEVVGATAEQIQQVLETVALAM